MKNILTNRAISALAVLGMIAIAVTTGPGVHVPALATAAQTTAVVGLGFWGTLGCIGCVAGFVIGAGTTVAGLAVVLAAQPEIGILCVSTCVAATT